MIYRLLWHLYYYLSLFKSISYWALWPTDCYDIYIAIYLYSNLLAIAYYGLLAAITSIPLFISIQTYKL